MTGRARPAAWWLLVPATVALAVGLLGIGVRSTFGGNAAVDEPQYLLTALSLWEDRDLDISDELAAGRWREFHSAQLPVQTEVLPDGRQVSPHDPLLPLILAAPMGLFGWAGAKAAVALQAGVAAGLLAWLLVRRFRAPTWAGAVLPAVAFASPPLAVYGNQVYPEIPAALAVLVGVAAATAPALRRRHLATAAAAVVALPWLGAKYVLVAAALALGTAVVARGRVPARWLGWYAASLAGSALAWLGLHRLLYGGWTAYATGDAFQAYGELSVVGVDPDYWGRSLRLVALLVDDRYGLVPWQPAYAVLPAAVAVVLWRCRKDRGLVWLAVAPLLGGWATAVWVALTMHGFWWPGRQVVCVLPLAVVAVLAATRRLADARSGAGAASGTGPRTSRRPVRRAAAAAVVAVAAAGPLATAALLVAGWSRDLTWVSGFDSVPSPAYQLLRLVTPDYRGDAFWTGHALWGAALILSAAAALRVSRPSLDSTTRSGALPGPPRMKEISR